MTNIREQAIHEMRKAWSKKQLTLYLGAGVSVASGLPTWEQLVAAMYYDAISRKELDGWRPFPNYLYAIAEYHLKQSGETLDITARRLRNLYPDQNDFLEQLRSTLYPWINEEGIEIPDPHMIRRGNSTLKAVAKLCKKTNSNQGLNAVVTYNYDYLLEHVVNNKQYQPIWNNTSLPENLLPIYHVHGFVPAEGTGSGGSEIVFTEDQYNLAASAPYSWSNLVQINCFSTTVGLMVGLSLSDRNMRRLLDAVMRTPGKTCNYALMMRPKRYETSQREVDAIDQKAREYIERFQSSGVKSRAKSQVVGRKTSRKQTRSIPPPMVKGPQYVNEILGILRAVQKVDEIEQYRVLEQLGIYCIWYDDHHEIPDILHELTR